MGKTEKETEKTQAIRFWTLVFLAALAVFCFSGYKLIAFHWLQDRHG